ncbi:methyltransferase domain-containing protein [Bacillus halotolerans]|uniref:Methyltransferase domain-containing protein n=2 Tax=Bacillus subtilis group TaxID=653685 RepID=A0ABY7HVN7_9BACI|nr:methyltransferase domain-containing protein [Bacillus halotolerans]MDG0767202.1 methyltransferase domain-containing protein [Bacillus halotolerans]UUI82613.1 methyltransferase domain-containing protein [Bacillus halotolerans]WAT19542.1 methyltransferase domain-containing protein [Bacillus halotolerans]
MRSRTSEIIKSSYPTVNDINEMSYVEFLAFLNQPNIPPGGFPSIKKAVEQCNFEPGSLLLDAGCNTGFVTHELARLTGSKVIGLDISHEMISTAKEYAKLKDISYPGLTTFMQGDATNLVFPDDLFDGVLCGGSTAFMENPKQAIKEYARVVRPWGYIVEIEFYYKEKPQPELLNRVNSTLGTNMKAFSKADWIQAFEDQDNLQQVYFYDGELKHADESIIEQYVEQEVESFEIPQELKGVVKDKWLELYQVLFENRKLLNYCILIYRKVTKGAWW